LSLFGLSWYLNAIMCGISGYIGSRQAMPIVLSGLRCLEYRGYDSAGIAVWDGKHIGLRRTVGNLDNLERLLKKEPLKGVTGIGHTRWATHGKPSEDNAHPHCTENLALVHNGIIENYMELRQKIAKAGRKLKSETDTETLAHLIQMEINRGKEPLSAMRNALKQAVGSYAIIVMCKLTPDRLYVARQGSPLIIGCGNGEQFIASDIPALIPHTQSIVELLDGEIAVVTREGRSISDLTGEKKERRCHTVDWTASVAEKAGFKHFMLKEIFEQPHSIRDTLRGRIFPQKMRISLDGAEEKLKKVFEHLTQITIVACGTSYHAALTGEYLLGDMCEFPVVVDTASEYRYRNHFTDPRGLTIAISQSGETADTLAALRLAKKNRSPVLAISNIMGSSVAREADATILTRAGIEIGVASTKAFTTQLTVLCFLGLYWAKLHGKLSKKDFKIISERLLEIPRQIQGILRKSDEIEKIARHFTRSEGFLFLGRGVNYPIALEGALKLKEISYQWAEGYPAGEMKHGPIALIDRGTPVVFLAPDDPRTYHKTISNIEEVKARHATVIALATAGDKELKRLADHIIYIPKTTWFLTPILMAVPLQLFAYHLANLRGKSIDQPRNLAKSVTVE